MFSIFTYIMSRVTHSEPGLPMVHVQKVRDFPQTKLDSEINSIPSPH